RMTIMFAMPSSRQSLSKKATYRVMAAKNTARGEEGRGKLRGRGRPLAICAELRSVGHDSLFHSRLGAGGRGRHADGGVAAVAGGRPAGGEIGLPALLGGGASQHAGHRERGDGGGDCASRRGHTDDSRGFGWH